MMKKRILASILLAPLTIFIVVSLAYISYLQPLFLLAMVMIVPAVVGLHLLEQTDSLWEIQLYPNTPIGFHLVYSATLEECLRLAQDVEREG